MEKKTDDLEDILVNKEQPSRTDDRESKPKKIAKLTKRTISSLKSKIKEKKMDLAYQKYNKKYQKMKKALINAEEVKKEKKDGADISETELNMAYSVVTSYGKKLGKLGAKLLEDDITKVVSSQTVKPIRVPRILYKRMRKLVLAVAKIREKQKTKKLHKEMSKEIKEKTAEYIDSSLEKAVFSNPSSATLREPVDKEIIKKLGLKGGKDDTERRLETLRGFISKNGEEPMFKKTINDEESLTKKTSSINTDIPPVTPQETVKKGAPIINVDELIKRINTSNEKKINEDSKSTQLDNEILDKMERLKENDEDKKRNKQILAYKKEKERLESGLGKNGPFADMVDKTNIALLERKIEELSSPKHKIEEQENSKKITPFIEMEDKNAMPNFNLKKEDEHNLDSPVATRKDKKEELIKTIHELGGRVPKSKYKNAGVPEKTFDDGIDQGAYYDALQTGYKLIEGKDKLTDKEQQTKEEYEEIQNVLASYQVASQEKKEKQENDKPYMIPIEIEEEQKQIVPIEIEEEQKEQKQIVPIKIEEEQKDKLKDGISNLVKVNPNAERATQISTPGILRVTLEDIKNLSNRCDAAKKRIEELKKEREELLSQKELLTLYIKKAKDTLENVNLQESMTAENQALKDEVRNLNSEAFSIAEGLKRSK